MTTPHDLIPEAYRHKFYLRRRECSEASGLGIPTFDKMAWEGTGPKFVKKSPRGPALYPVREFFEWLAGLGQQAK